MMDGYTSQENKRFNRIKIEMKYIKYIIISGLLMYCNTSWSQQESIFTQYFQNMNIVNPAYAGVDNETVITSGIRSQWTGIAEAPETQTLAISTYLGKNVGLGISMVRDKTFIEKQTFLGLDFSYKLALSNGMDLYFGIKAGGNFYDVNTTGLETYSLQADPSLFGISNFNPNIGTGLLLKTNNWYLSLSVPRLLNTERSRNEDGIATVATDRPHFYATFGYDFKLNETGSILMKPSTFFRYVDGAPISMDFNNMLSFNDKFSIGGTFRTDNSYAAIASITFKKKFTFGFAYETSSRRELARAQNTNEILFRVKF